MTAVSPERALEDVVRKQLANITSRPHTANECADAILAAASRYAASIMPSLPEKRPEPQPGELRTALESLAAFWVREYVTADGWPDVCAKQLLDVLGGAREPGTAPKPAPELGGMSPGRRAHRRWLESRWPDMSPRAIARDWGLISDQARTAWEAAGTGDPS